MAKGSDEEEKWWEEQRAFGLAMSLRASGRAHRELGVVGSAYFPS